MLLTIPDVSERGEQVCEPRASGSGPLSGWMAASPPATQSSRVKSTTGSCPRIIPRRAETLGDMILAALQRNPLFISAALPLRVFPPLFNQYAGRAFIRQSRRQRHPADDRYGYRIRTDLSATLFLSDPSEYDGGELAVEDTYGVHTVKLPAGHMVLYPSTSLHHVTSGDPRRTRRVVLLDSEPGSRRRRAARCCSISTPPFSG